MGLRAEHGRSRQGGAWRHVAALVAIGLAGGCERVPESSSTRSDRSVTAADSPLILSTAALRDAFLIDQDGPMYWRFDAERCVAESWGDPLPLALQELMLSETGAVFRVAGRWQLLDDGHRLRITHLQADGPPTREQVDIPIALGNGNTLQVAGRTCILQNYLDHREILPHESFVGRLVAVRSGHLVQVEHGGQLEMLRLAGLLGPDPQYDVGQQAIERCDNLMRGRRLQIKVYDPPGEQPRRAQIFTSSFYWVNLQLIQEGLAWHDKTSDGEWLFSTREDAARESGLGIWAHPELSPPWWPESP